MGAFSIDWFNGTSRRSLTKSLSHQPIDRTATRFSHLFCLTYQACTLKVTLSLDTRMIFASGSLCFASNFLVSFCACLRLTAMLDLEKISTMGSEMTRDDERYCGNTKSGSQGSSGTITHNDKVKASAIRAQGSCPTRVGHVSSRFVHCNQSNIRKVISYVNLELPDPYIHVGKSLLHLVEPLDLVGRPSSMFMAPAEVAREQRSEI